MFYRTRLPVVILTTGITAMIVLVASGASAQTQQQKQQQKQQLQQQKAAAAANAKNASDAEKAAEGNAATTRKSLVELNEALKAAQKDVDEATAALKAVEDQIIDGQSADSDFGKLRDQFRAAEKKYQDARKAVLDSDDFKAKLEAARNSDERAEAIMALKKEFDALPEIADPRTKLQAVKEKYEPLRTDLLEADSKWTDASSDLKAKKDALDALNHQFSEANAAANKAKAAARKAEAAAAAAARNAANSQQPKKRRGY